MKRLALVIAIIAVGILVVSVLNISQQALSQQDDEQNTVNTAIGVTSETYEGPVVLGSPLPDDTPVISEPEPTATPLAPAPSPEPALAGAASETYSFDDAALEGWTFDQVFSDPAGVPAWSVADGLLASPQNDQTSYTLNDVLAIAPARLEGDGALEVSTVINTNTGVGLVAGYQSNDNYVALLLSAPDSPRGAGLSIIQVAGGEYTKLAENSDLSVDPNQWYKLRLEIQGTTVNAGVDGEMILTATLQKPLADNRVGLYAGDGGDSFFDYLQTFDN